MEQQGQRKLTRALGRVITSIVLQDPLMTNLSKLDFQGLQDLLPEIPLWVKTPDYEKVNACLRGVV